MLKKRVKTSKVKMQSVLYFVSDADYFSLQKVTKGAAGCEVATIMFPD